MRTKAILLNTDMVKAILAGSKTQTRRVVKYKKKISDEKVGFTTFCNTSQFSVRGIHENGEWGESIFNLPFAVNDIMWVRETWQSSSFLCSDQSLNHSLDNYDYIYKASENGRAWEQNTPKWKWRPSIFMPKKACRLFLQITRLKVERLQDITEESAKKEGVIASYIKRSRYVNYTWHGIGGDDSFSNYCDCDTAKDSFQSLWYRVYGEKSWDDNPYVFVYEFHQIEKPENFT